MWRRPGELNTKLAYADSFDTFRHEASASEFANVDRAGCLNNALPFHPELWLTLGIGPLPGLQFRYVGGNRRESYKIVRRAFDVIASLLHAVVPKHHVWHSPDIATSSGEVYACVLDQGEEVLLVLTVEEHF